MPKPSNIDEWKDELKRPDPMAKALEDKNITCDTLAEALVKELEAEETKFFADKGVVIDQKDVVAWGVRQRARQDAHKLRGDYPNEKLEHTGTIVFESNVPEPDPLPEEKPKTQEEK